MATKREQLLDKARKDAQAKKVLEAHKRSKMTIEDKILSSPIIDNPVVDFIGDTLSAGAKTVSHVTTPVTEAVRGAVRGTRELVGQDVSNSPRIDLLAEFDDPIGAPSDRAGLAPLVREVSDAFGGIGDQPVFEPEWEQFPKTAQVIRHLSIPRESFSALAEVAIPVKGLPRVGGVDVTPRASRVARMAEPKNRRKVIDNWLKKSSTNKTAYNELKRTGKIEEIIDLIDEDLSYMGIRGMESTIDRVEGPIVRDFDYSKDRLNTYRDRSNSEIGNLANKQRDIISNIPRMGEIDPAQIRSRVMENLSPKLTDVEMIQAQKTIDDILSPMNRDFEMIGDIRTARNLEARSFEIDRLINDEVNRVVNDLSSQSAGPMNRFNEAQNMPSMVDSPNMTTDPSTGARVDWSNSGQIPNQQRMAMMDSAINEMDSIQAQIKSITDGAADPTQYPRLSDLRRKRAEIQSRLQKEFGNLDFSDEGLMDVLRDYQNNQWQRIYDMRRNANTYLDDKNLSQRNIEKTGQTHGAESVSKVVQEIIDEFGLQSPADVMELAKTNRSIAQRLGLMKLFNREHIADRSVSAPYGKAGLFNTVVDSIDTHINPARLKAYDAYDRIARFTDPVIDIGSPIVLQQYKIPRDSESINQNRKMIGQKILYDVGQEAFAVFSKIEDPQTMKAFLRQLDQTHPWLFEPDEYRRFDGEIFDPILKNKALENVNRNSEISKHQKADMTENILIYNKIT